MPAPRRDGGFAFICLHAATALRPVASKARSVLLASGTLGPLPALAAELGLQEVPCTSLSPSPYPSSSLSLSPAQQDKDNSSNSIVANAFIALYDSTAVARALLMFLMCFQMFWSIAPCPPTSLT